MRVLHVPVKSTTYNSDEIVLLISRALANFPSLNQIVLHFQGNGPDLRSDLPHGFSSPSLRLEITDSDSW